MARILCLHGQGTSSEIYEKQLFGIKRGLPKDWEFVFADGDVECDRAPGIPEAVPGPFLCYYDGISCDAQQAAHELLQIIIEEDGPFDGIIAFSQGACLAMSYLLELQRKEPGVVLPFKFVVFFAPNVLLSADTGLYTEEIGMFHEGDFTYFAQIVDGLSGSNDAASTKAASGDDTVFIEAAPSGYQTDADRRKAIFVSQAAATLRAGTQIGSINAAQFKESAAQRDTSAIPKMYHPALVSERIRIPAVHILGAKDHEEIRAQFKVLPYFYESGRLKEVVHSEGHEIPRNPEETQKIVDAIQDAYQQSRMIVH